MHFTSILLGPPCAIGCREGGGAHNLFVGGVCLGAYLTFLIEQDAGRLDVALEELSGVYVLRSLEQMIEDDAFVDHSVDLSETDGTPLWPAPFHTLLQMASTRRANCTTQAQRPIGYGPSRHNFTHLLVTWEIEFWV